MDNLIIRQHNQNEFLMILSNSQNYPLAGAYFLNYHNTKKEGNCFTIRTHLLNFVQVLLRNQEVLKSYFKNPDISLEDLILPTE